MKHRHFKGLCIVAMVCAMAPISNATTVSFSFNGGGVTSSGTLTVVAAPDNISGVATPGTYEITGITGTFADSNDGISGTITGLVTPLSYVTGTTATAASPVAFTSAGMSYDDLLFAGANAAADCPGYPFGGGILTYTEWRLTFRVGTLVSSSAMASCQVKQDRCTERLIAMRVRFWMTRMPAAIPYRRAFLARWLYRRNRARCC